MPTEIATAVATDLAAFSAAALVALKLAAPIAYVVIAGLFIHEAAKALRCGEPCAKKVVKAVAYLVITAKALLLS